MQRCAWHLRQIFLLHFQNLPDIIVRIISAGSISVSKRLASLFSCLGMGERKEIKITLEKTVD